MKNVYYLGTDVFFSQSLANRMKIESDCNMLGTNTDASMGYSEIQQSKPDILIFEYPSNFTATQLVEAMSTVNPNMKYIGLLNDVSKRPELEQAGIKDIINKPCSVDDIITGITGKSNDGSLVANPFKSIDNNVGNNVFDNVPNSPFGNSQPLAQNSQNNQMNNIFQNSQPQQSMPNMQGMPNMQNHNMADNNSFYGRGATVFKQKLIAIHCPKGGVGKTSVSINIAALLSTVRLGNQPLKTLIVDMDWDFGDVCVNLGKQPAPNVMKWVKDIQARRAIGSNNMVFTQAQIEKYLIEYDTGLKILAAPSTHNDTVEIPDDAAKIIIDNLKNTDFDIIIFDCGNNTNTHTLQVLNSVSAVYEIVTMDYSTLNDTHQLMTTLKSINYPIDRVRAIVNKLPKTDREVSIEEIADALQLKVAAVIPENEKVRTYNNKGVPLVLSKTSNAFTESIKKICNVIVGSNLFDKKRPSPQNNKSGGFFSRLFKR